METPSVPPEQRLTTPLPDAEIAPGAASRNVAEDIQVIASLKKIKGNTEDFFIDPPEQEPQEQISKARRVGNFAMKFTALRAAKEYAQLTGFRAKTYTGYSAAKEAVVPRIESVREAKADRQREHGEMQHRQSTEITKRSNEHLLDQPPSEIKATLEKRVRAKLLSDERRTGEDATAHLKRVQKQVLSEAVAGRSTEEKQRIIAAVDEASVETEIPAESPVEVDKFSELVEVLHARQAVNQEAAPAPKRTPSPADMPKKKPMTSGDPDFSNRLAALMRGAEASPVESETQTTPQQVFEQLERRVKAKVSSDPSHRDMADKISDARNAVWEAYLDSVPEESRERITQGLQNLLTKQSEAEQRATETPRQKRERERREQIEEARQNPHRYIND